ncbi:hypothetical protein Hanom_Chr08g00707151 [Helianthus anomalus]
MKRVEREQVECFKKLLRVQEPVNVLCDGMFIKWAVERVVDPRPLLENFLGGTVALHTTRCVKKYLNDRFETLKSDSDSLFGLKDLLTVFRGHAPGDPVNCSIQLVEKPDFRTFFVTGLNKNFSNRLQQTWSTTPIITTKKKKADSRYILQQVLRLNFSGNIIRERMDWLLHPAQKRARSGLMCEFGGV